MFLKQLIGTKVLACKCKQHQAQYETRYEYQKENENWVIKGPHLHISNALAAELFIVTANPINEENLEENESFFIVPRDTPGLKIAELPDNKENSTVSWRHGCSAGIEFNSCKIPLNYKLNIIIYQTTVFP